MKLDCNRCMINKFLTSLKSLKCAEYWGNSIINFYLASFNIFIPAVSYGWGFYFSLKILIVCVIICLDRHPTEGLLWCEQMYAGRQFRGAVVALYYSGTFGSHFVHCNTSASVNQSCFQSATNKAPHIAQLLQGNTTWYKMSFDKILTWYRQLDI